MAKSKSVSQHQKVNNFQKIRELGAKQQHILALMLLERMKPNYQLFVQVTDFPQPYVLDNMMDSLWQRVLTKGAKVSLSAMENKVEELTPSEHDFEMYGVFPAIYFCTGLLTYIAGAANEEDFDPVAISKISQGSIVHLIEYQAEEELDNSTIREHELMQLEMSFLAETIEWLENTRFKNNDAAQVQQQAMERVFADGVSNIGIEIDF